MALIVKSQIEDLAEDIVPESEADATEEQIAARTAAVENVKNLAEKILQYIVDNMEINGVETDLDAGVRTIETYVAGVGTNGGTLAGSVPINGNVNDGKLSTATQSNGGKGLIA